MIFPIIMGLGAIAGTSKRLQSDHWWHIREESLVLILTIIGTWALALVNTSKRDILLALLLI